MENMENQVNEQTEIKQSKPMYYYAGFGFLVALIVVALSLVALTVYRAEKKLATDKFTLAVAKTIGLPAGFVNGQRIYYTDFIQDLQAVNESYKNAPVEQAAFKPSDEQLRLNIWEMLVKNAVISQEAAKNKVIVTAQDVEEEFANLITTVGSVEEVERLIKVNYGWKPNQFKERILKPFILQEKLSLAPGLLDKLGNEPEIKAQSVLEQAQKGEKSFEELAQEFGEDGTSAQGGDLGWFGVGMMVPEFEAAVASMEVGEIKGLVQTQFGYHIIKLEEKRENDLKATEWRAKHILIMTADFDGYINGLVEQAKIRQWINL